METNKENITFRQWLDKNNIEYNIVICEGEECVILKNENDLRNYEGELLSIFPKMEFKWNITPNHNTLN